MHGNSFIFACCHPRLITLNF